jgi:hypothetical protein
MDATATGAGQGAAAACGGRCGAVRHRVEGSSGGRPSPAAARLHRRSSGGGAGPAAAAQPTRGGAAAATLRAAPLAPSRADAWQGRPPRPQSASSRRRTRVTRMAVLLPVVGPSWRRRTAATAATRASTTTAAAAELTRLGGGWDGAGGGRGCVGPTPRRLSREPATPPDLEESRAHGILPGSLEDAAGALHPGKKPRQPDRRSYPVCQCG